MHSKFDLMRRIKDKIISGLQLLRQAILFSKSLQASHKKVIECINFIFADNDKFIDEVVRLFVGMPTFIHSINIVRWYALFRNDGRYNKDTYVTALTQVCLIKEQLEALAD